MRVLLLAVVVMLWAASPASAQPAGGATWSAADCATCHPSTVGPAFQRTKHAGLTESCATCHVNVAEHVKAQMAGESNGPVPSVKKQPAAAINATCLTCQENGKQS